MKNLVLLLFAASLTFDNPLFHYLWSNAKKDGPNAFVLSKTLSDTPNTSGVGMTSMVADSWDSLAMQNIQIIYV